MSHLILVIIIAISAIRFEPPTFALLLLIWLLFGFIASGFIFAQSQREFPSLKNKYFAANKWQALMTILYGFSGLLSCCILIAQHGYYGWLPPWSKIEQS